MKAFFRFSIVTLLVFFVAAGLTGCKKDPASPSPDPDNHAPNVPTIDSGAGAPTDGATGVSIMQDLHWQCSDPDGDDLTYDVYWGSTSPPPSVSTGQTAMTFDPGMMSYSTVYYWKVVAIDPDDETTSSSEWSFTTGAVPEETISDPDTPLGPSMGETGESLAYTTGGAVSSFGHTVEYRFDWDDGTYSSWSTGTGSSHSWVTPGTYEVKAQARCETHASVESGWSTATAVVVTAPAETINKPTISEYPSGASQVGAEVYFNMGPPVNSSLGHTLEFRYDFGDGNFSSWVSVKSATHTYSAPGTFEVRGQARCALHTDVLSPWSDTVSVEITAAGETITTPVINNPSNAEDWTFTIEYEQLFGIVATSSMAHILEFRYDWGNGVISEWGNASRRNPAYGVIGDYEVRGQARCRDHPDIESAWSEVKIAHVTGFVSMPVLSGPTSGTVGQEITFTTSVSTCSEGHDIEYRLFIADWTGVVGSPQPWTTADALTYTFDSARTWYVRLQARCVDEDVLSDYSSRLDIVISNP